MIQNLDIFYFVNHRLNATFIICTFVLVILVLIQEICRIGNQEKFTTIDRDTDQTSVIGYKVYTNY